jgi:HD-GYP domain-containing protein (c-di-GMP phosphodiesterase class II)
MKELDFEEMHEIEWVPARRSQIKFYKDVALYNKIGNGKYVLYKSPGITLNDLRIDEEKHPEELFIRQQDKIRAIQEAQRGFNACLDENIKAGNIQEVKAIVRTIVEETLAEPRSGSLEGVSETVDILLTDYARDAHIVKNLLEVAATDYTTVIHSINVMAFALGFAFYTHLSKQETKVIGVSALLHDVGKIKIDNKILTSSKKLSDSEFEEMKKHTILGYDILTGCNFADGDICLGALEHHEKLDGSGYPCGKEIISHTSQMLAIIDCYEAITNDERVYRSAKPPLEALKQIKEDAECGKYNRAIFEKFAYSLL